MNPNPDPNQNTSETQNLQQLPQLENETPMDITIFPSSEIRETTVEPEKITQPENKKGNETSPQIEFTIQEPQDMMPISSIAQENINPVESIITSPIETISPKLPETTSIQPTEQPVVSQQLPSFDLSSGNGKEESNTTQSNQKVAIVVGVAFGIFLVSGISYYLLSNNRATPVDVSTTIPSQPVAELVKPAPVVVNPEPKNLNLDEYKVKIDAVGKKYNSLITSNPVNLTGTTLNMQTVKLLGDEVFALYNEVSQYPVDKDLKGPNDRVSENLQSIFKSYDELLQAYKLNGKLTPEMKAKFLSETKTSTDSLNNYIQSIINLK